jgi:hypothetical protein
MKKLITMMWIAGVVFYAIASTVFYRTSANTPDYDPESKLSTSVSAQLSKWDVLWLVRDGDSTFDTDAEAVAFSISIPKLNQ